MGLEKASTRYREEISGMLVDYWTSRGMKHYDKKWARDYIIKGHKKETIKDEFFIYEEDGDIVGIVSLVTDISGVAEIRDFLIKKKYRKQGYGVKILEKIVRVAEERKLRKLLPRSSRKRRL